MVIAKLSLIVIAKVVALEQFNHFGRQMIRQLQAEFPSSVHNSIWLVYAKLNGLSYVYLFWEEALSLSMVWCSFSALLLPPY